MELTLATPALLFPAISLLLLAYTKGSFVNNLDFLLAGLGALLRCDSLVWRATPHSSRLASHPNPTAKSPSYFLTSPNRFLAVASVIRQLHSQIKSGQAQYHEEIRSLRHRVSLIRHMQGVGVLSLFFCVLCMFLLFAGWVFAGKLVFGGALLLLLWSLALSVREIALSGDALNLHLRDLEMK